MHTETKGFHDYLEIGKRRRKGILLSLTAVFTIAATVAVLMPPTYKSTSTILIEEQEIPREYIVSTVNGFAEQRLQTINQRVMSSTRLMEIINKYNLYSDHRKKWTNEEIIARMRDDIKFETLNADLEDPRSGRTKVAIAFTVSYCGENPAVVQQISNVLASLYLEENLRVRGQQAEGAAKFFQEEMRVVQARMAEMDGKLADFKGRNINALPELAQTNLQELYRLDQNVEQLADQLKTLKEKENSLKVQLAGIPSDAETKEQAHLNELRNVLHDLKSRVSDQYPDVVKLKKEIAELEKREKEGKRDSSGVKADNLSYVTIEAQLSGARSEVESVKRQIEALSRKRDEFRRRMAVSPKVEEGYKAIFIERTNLQTKYEDLMKKYMEANVAQGLEKGQMGDRFTLIDPARLPEKPVRPNIPVFLLAGLVLGSATGVGVAALKEAGDRSFHTVDALARALSLPIVAGVPEIVTPRMIARRKKRRTYALAGVFVCLLVSVAAFHFLVMDLDVLWARVGRRFSL